jgi:hypothetical protein
MRSLSWLILFVSLLVTIASRSAFAADKTEVKEKKARVECAAGNFREGVRLLAELWVDTKNPTHIYNQARCYEQSAQNSAAAARFIEYLRKAGPLQPDDVKAIEKRIEDLERKPSSTSQPTVISMPPPATAALATATPAPAASPQSTVEPPIVQLTNTPPANQSGSGLRTAGIITAAVGGAGLVTGVIFNLKFNSVTSEMQKVDGYTPGRASDRDTFGTLTWTGYGVGTACVVGGAVLYYLGMRSGGGSASSVALVPALAPGQAGALLQGAF